MANDIDQETRALMRKNPTLDWAVATCLIEWVENKRTLVTYGELAPMVGESLRELDPRRSGKMHPLGLRWPLGRIQKYCKECSKPSLPVLPAMVVNAGTRTPGPGFDKAYREWYLNGENRDLSDIISAEQEKVLGGADWKRLLMFLSEGANP